MIVTKLDEVAIQSKLLEIKALRSEGNYERADIIRKELLDNGIELSYQRDGSLQWMARIQGSYKTGKV